MKIVSYTLTMLIALFCIWRFYVTQDMFLLCWATAIQELAEIRWSLNDA